jgi:hypothetical protein
VSFNQDDIQKAISADKNENIVGEDFNNNDVKFLKNKNPFKQFNKFIEHGLFSYIGNNFLNKDNKQTENLLRNNSTFNFLTTVISGLLIILGISSLVLLALYLAKFYSQIKKYLILPKFE